MGGHGSGRRYSWSGSKTTTESQRSIDIRWLKQRGGLQHGSMGSLTWSRGGKRTGSIHYRMESDRMVLVYNHRSHDREDWEPVEESIRIDQTPCNYGGYRKWFLCPRCSKRVAVLYAAGKYFLCRHCYRLPYVSQNESTVYRMMRKQRKIRERLGASGNLLDLILFKPKGMHQRTFDRLRLQEKQVGYLSNLMMCQELGIAKNAAHITDR